MAPGLVSLLVADTGQHLHYVTADQLEAAGLPPEQAPSLALDHTWEALPRIERHGRADGVMMLTCGGDFESSLLLYPALWARLEEELGGPVVVGVPARDLLFCASAERPDAVEQLRALVDDAFAREVPHPLAEALYVLRDDGWQLYEETSSRGPACTNCEQPVEPDAAFCAHCGEAVWSGHLWWWNLAAAALLLVLVPVLVAVGWVHHPWVTGFLWLFALSWFGYPAWVLTRGASPLQASAVWLSGMQRWFLWLTVALALYKLPFWWSLVTTGSGPTAAERIGWAQWIVLPPALLAVVGLTAWLHGPPCAPHAFVSAGIRASGHDVSRRSEMERRSFAVRGGGQVEAELLGAGAPVVVIHEWWGLNDDMRRVGQQLANAGFLAVLLDAYHGRVTTDPTEAAQLSNALDTSLTMREVGGVADALGEPVAVMGFCLGGAVSFACAQVEGVRAAVPFYGVPAPSRFDASRLLCPIQAHFAGTDPWASPEKGRALQEQVRAAGGRMDLHVYEGTVHAFMRPSDPNVFHPEAAALAWERALSFLRAE